jgi:subtilisin family serine protease
MLRRWLLRIGLVAATLCNLWGAARYINNDGFIARGQAGAPIVSADDEVLLVHFHDWVTPAARDAQIAQIGGELVEWLAPLHVAKVRIVQGRANLHQARQRLALDKSVLLVEDDGLVEGLWTPSDPKLVDANTVYAPQLLNLFSAWEYTIGSHDVTIAVLDSGITYEHPEFSGRILPGKDLINQDEHPADDLGHGTHVAGIAAAAIDNQLGSAGVCGACQILPVKVLNKNNFGTMWGVANGLLWAVDQGADIVVMSLGSRSANELLRRAVAYAGVHNVLLVAAAGNNGNRQAFYPAAYPGVLAVSATNRNDLNCDFSNFGDYVDIAAPGDNIFSTHMDLSGDQQGYMSMSGTSTSVPFVAGVAGLLLAQDPTRTAVDLERLLTTTALDLGAIGRDDHFGYGRVDPLAALQAEAAITPTLIRIGGYTWQDLNPDNQRQPETEAVWPGIEVTITDRHGRFIGLAFSDATGAWQRTITPSTTYTIQAQIPTQMVVTGAFPLVITPTHAITRGDLNFGYAPRPAPEDMRGFRVERRPDQVILSWRVTNPVVKNFIIDRSLTADGPYVELTPTPLMQVDSAIVGERQVSFVDPVPNELRLLTLYYRVRLLPGGAVSPSTPVEPLAQPFRQFLPLVVR